MPTDALIEQTLASLVNGVSRQPATQRLPSQAEEQTNVVSDVAAGVTRRPPTEHVGELSTNVPFPAADGVFTHVINRGDGQRFMVVIEEGDLNVWNLDTGAEVVVNDNALGAPGTYLAVDDFVGGLKAEDMFEATTIADYTFIVNRTITPAMDAGLSAGRDEDHEFLLYLKPGATSGYANIVHLTIGDTEVSNPATETITTGAALDLICTNLCGTTAPDDTVGIVAGDSEDWRFTRLSESVLHGYQFQNANVPVNASDEYGESIHELMTTGPNGEHPNVRKFSDLPAEALDGFVVQVVGDDGNNEDQFYVVYDADARVWRETVEPGLADSFNSTSLPHVLIYDEGTGEFSFEPPSWADRLVGDEESAAQPSFIGNPINDVFIHENRLCFLAGENVIASESRDFFNFWPTTVTTLVDSDPLDVSGTGHTVAIWDYAVPLRNTVLLFSSVGNTVAQLHGSRDKRLTVENARVTSIGEWAHSRIRPQAIGDGIYFALDRGGRTSVFLLRERDVDVWDANEVTAHIDTYLPTGLIRVAAGRAENTLVYRGPDHANELFVYRFHYLGSEQVISSWSKWTFTAGDVILGAEWVESVLYLLIERDGGSEVHLEKMDFGLADEDGGVGNTPLGHRVHLDSLFSATGTYSAGTGLTTWTVPYNQDTIGGTYLIVRGGAWGDQRGGLVTVEDAATDGTITAFGDWSDHPVYIGRQYSSEYQLSEVVYRDRNGDGRVSGRLQLRRGRVVYSETGTFEVVVTCLCDDESYHTTFTPFIIGGSSIGLSPLDNGTFEFDIGGSSDDIRISFESDSFLPFQLSAFDWEGRFYDRAARA